MKKRPVLSKYKGTHHSFAEITIVNEPPFSTAVSKLLWGSWKTWRWIYLLTHTFFVRGFSGQPKRSSQDKAVGKNLVYILCFTAVALQIGAQTISRGNTGIFALDNSPLTKPQQCFSINIKPIAYYMQKLADGGHWGYLMLLIWLHYLHIWYNLLSQCWRQRKNV